MNKLFSFENPAWRMKKDLSWMNFKNDIYCYYYDELRI